MEGETVNEADNETLLSGPDDAAEACPLLLSRTSRCCARSSFA